ncbi:hypothetical protein ACFLZJ_01520 [Nanoarchaeota archaeon]
MKKLLIVLIMSVFMLSMVSAATLFEDGFESGNFNNWDESDNDWHITTHSEHSGSYAAWTADSESQDDLRREISTIGYNNIVFSYWYRIYNDLGSNDHVYVHWYDGSTWHELVDYVNVNDGDWIFETFNLPSGAINNPDFEIRFRSKNLDDWWDDKFMLDDVLVTGDTLEQVNDCELIIDNPTDDQTWYDSEAVDIKWHLEGTTCTPIDRFDVWYKKDGDCSNLDSGWFNIPGGQDLSSGDVEGPYFPSQYSYLWDKPSESGTYCVKAKVSSNGARDVSEEFYVDLAPPVVSMDVGGPNVGDCTEGTGDCYVNQDTDITLSCDDNDPDEPWQSGPDYTEYRYSLNGNPFTGWMTYGDPFSFPEDSNHVLEYRCFDNVGKESPTKEKNFYVDSVAPVIEKTVVGPQYAEVGQCPPAPKSNDICHIDGVTEIHSHAYDPDPHPVNVVECMWGYRLKGQSYGSGYSCNGPDCVIQFPEESEHELYIECWDALGNEYRDEETFYVDKTPPVTTIGWNGPYLWGSGPEQYIDGVTTLDFTAEDFPSEHDSGVAETYYRVSGVIDDDYCWSAGQGWRTTPKEAEGWLTYDTPFGIAEESCHVVEYYSVDNVDKEEDVQTWFVFVDKSPPELLKEVGEPAVECTPLKKLLGVCEDDWDWKITMDTPVHLSCNDPDPHPSGVDELCWRLTLDGDIIYGHGADQEGWVCGHTNEVTLRFHEESEHLLEFYCVDEVEKMSEIDSEMFKVEGEAFEIPLHEKWNLISIPFNLISNNIAEVFSQMEGKEVEIEGVWSYDETGWHVYKPEGPSDLEVIRPGFGYWVKADCEEPGQNDLCGHLEVGGSLLSTGPGVPPSRDLQEGWNLIGHYGTDSDQAYCSLFSLVDTQEGFPRWSALYGYNPIQDTFRALDSSDLTHAGRGYWLEIDVMDMYSPATACWGFSPSP